MQSVSGERTHVPFIHVNSIVRGIVITLELLPLVSPIWSSQGKVNTIHVGLGEPITIGGNGMLFSSMSLAMLAVYRSRFLGHKYCHLGPDLRVASFDDRRS